VTAGPSSSENSHGCHRGTIDWGELVGTKELRRSQPIHSVDIPRPLFTDLIYSNYSVFVVFQEMHHTRHLRAIRSNTRPSLACTYLSLCTCLGALVSPTDSATLSGRRKVRHSLEFLVNTALCLPLTTPQQTANNNPSHLVTHFALVSHHSAHLLPRVCAQIRATAT